MPGDRQPKTDPSETAKPQRRSSSAGKRPSAERRELIAGFLEAVCELKGFDFGARVTDRALEIWETVLGGVDPGVLRGALNHMLATLESGTYWPTPGDVLKRLGESGRIAAEQGWNQVVRRLRDHHYDPDQGGWVWEWTASEARVAAWEASGGRARRDDWDRGWYLVPPDLPAEAVYAIGAVGGWERIRDQHGGREHDFVRRGFLEAFSKAAAHPELLGPGEHEKARISGATGSLVADLTENGS